MLFGLKSASKVFQKQNKVAFEGIEGIHIIADDNVIAASNVKEPGKITYGSITESSFTECKVEF